MSAKLLKELAADAVGVYRDEFPRSGPDWGSGWWVEAWTMDQRAGLDCTFSEYIAACKAVWNDWRPAVAHPRV